LFVSAFGRFFRDFVAAIGRFPQRCGVLSGRATLAAVAVRQAEKWSPGPGDIPLPPNAQTKPDRTRREQRSEIDWPEVMKKIARNSLSCCSCSENRGGIAYNSLLRL
jgi:hypothetical protein